MRICLRMEKGDPLKIVRPRYAPKRASVQAPSGAVGLHYNLEELRASLSRRYFQGAFPQDVEVRWGRRMCRHKPRKADILLGHFDFVKRVAVIHPVLDQAWVPQYFVESVLYHEMLHAVVLPVKRRGKRRLLHPRRFQKLERRFGQRITAETWEQKHHARLLRS